MAVGIKIQVKGVKPNIGKFTSKLYDRSVRIWNEAISIFIVAVANVVATHQDTGMSLASLFPTARDVRAKGMPAITPKTAIRQGFTDIGGTYFPNRFKSVGLGRTLGEKCSKILYGDKSRPNFKFTFEIQVFQYLINEIGNNRAGIVLASIEAGHAAMMDYLTLHSQEIIPKFVEFMEPYTEES